MVESAALLVDEVLPQELMRQWVLRFPYPLRFLFASRPAVWSPEDRLEFREAAQASWGEFATTPEAGALVESRMSYLHQVGLVN